MKKVNYLTGKKALILLLGLLLIFMALSGKVSADTIKDRNGATIGIGNTDGNANDFLVDSTPKLPKPGDKFGNIEVISTATNVTNAETVLKIDDFNPDLFGAVIVSIPGKKDLPEIKLTAEYGVEELYSYDQPIYKQIDYNLVSDDNGFECPKDWFPMEGKKCYQQIKIWQQNGTEKITKTRINYYQNPEIARHKTVYIKLKSTWKATLGDMANDVLIKYDTWNKQLLWWNAAWKYKRKITITNNSPVAIVDGNYAIKVSVAGSTLTQKQTDCDDVRIVLDNNVTTTELDRNIMGACNGDFNVSFNIHENIGASASDGNHYLYYGNAAATAPTTDENILIWNDGNVVAWGDFDNNFSDSSGWSLDAGLADFNSSPQGSYFGGSLYCKQGDGATVSSTRNIQGMDSGTVEFWLKLDSTPSVNNSLWYTDDVTDNFEMYFNGTTASFRTNDGSGLNTLSFGINPLFYDIVGQWHYWRFTFGSAGKYVYMDNNLIAGDNTKIGGVEVTANKFKLCYASYNDINYSIDRFRLISGKQYFLPPTPMPQFDINYNTILPTATIGLEESNIVSLPDVNVVSPSDANYITQNNFLLEISIKDVDKNFQDFYSLDYNLSGTSGTQTYSDVNGIGWNCDSNIIATAQNCSKAISVAGFYDGNYAFGISVFDGTNYDFSNGGSFMIDRNAPVTTWDGNMLWQINDTNIHLTCTDSGSGCAVTKYRIGLLKKLSYGSQPFYSFGEWKIYDTNILFTNDGNWGIDFNSTDNLGMYEPIDTNISNYVSAHPYHVSIDRTTPVLNYDTNPFDPLVSHGIAESSYTFAFNYDDPGDIAYCRMQLYQDGAVVSDTNVMPTLLYVSGFTNKKVFSCSDTQPILAGSTYFENGRAIDSVGLTSVDTNTATIFINPPVTGGGGASIPEPPPAENVAISTGGGASANISPPDTEISIGDKNKFVKIVRKTYNIISLDALTFPSVRYAMENLADQEVTVNLIYDKAIAPFVVQRGLSEEIILAPHERKSVDFVYSGNGYPDKDYLSGAITFISSYGDIADTQSDNLVLYYKTGWISSLLLGSILGLPTLAWVGVFSGLGYLGYRTSKKRDAKS